MKLVTVFVAAVALLALVNGCDLASERIQFDRGWLSQLVSSQSGGLVAYDPQRLQNADFLLFYYGAKWCPPCHETARELVDVYNRLKSKYPNFEVIFISKDKGEMEMASYMQEIGMPWPAVRLPALEAMPEVIKAGGSGIPALVLIDNHGRVLAKSIEMGRYVGSKPVVEALESRLGEEPDVKRNEPSDAPTDSVVSRPINRANEVADQIKQKRQENPEIYGR